MGGVGPERCVATAESDDRPDEPGAMGNFLREPVHQSAPTSAPACGEVRVCEPDGGYRSGRSSLRETPEAASTARTRRGGHSSHWLTA